MPTTTHPERRLPRPMLGASTARLAVPLLVAACGACLGLVCAGPAAAQSERSVPIEQLAGSAVASPTEADGSRTRITNFDVVYVRPNPGQPEPQELLEATVTLLETPEGWVAPREGQPNKTFRLADVPSLDNQWFFDSALIQFSPAVVARLKALNLLGVYVVPDQNQIGVEDGVIVDRRPEGQTGLTLAVTTGVVTSLRTVGLGERLPEDQTVDNPIHQRIRDRSPVYPATENRPQSDLLRRDLIDDYVFRLNRHPGRRADVAVAASGTEESGVALDYVVTENRPWMLFAQASNTGTKSADSDIRWRFGFIHNQLTNNDDIFSVDYMTGNFNDDVHSVNVSYSAPIFGSERLRGRLYGSWYEYDASTVGLGGLNFTGDGWSAGGELIANFYQDRDLFLDLIGGVRWENVTVDSNLPDSDGDQDFFLPYVGVRMERVRLESQTFAGVMLEFNVPGIAGTDSGDDLDRLGRLNTDDSWATLLYDASHSFYLEPLFAKDALDAKTLAHELFLSVRGQWAVDARLSPTFQAPIGGLYTVRGYHEALVAGDSVLLATAEYRYHIPKGMAPSAQPGEFFGTPFRWVPQYDRGFVDWDLIAKAFVDFGQTWDNDRLSFEDDTTLVSAGVGLELQLTRRLNGRLDLAFPLKDYDAPSGNDLDVDVGDWFLHWVVTDRKSVV